MTTDAVPTADSKPPTPEGAGADSVEVLSADLRELRLEAGNPTLAALSHGTGISKSVLSEAFTGRRVPSARTISATVAHLGGDVRAWVRRRDALDAAAAPSPTPPTDDDAPEAGTRVPPVRPVRRHVSLRTAVVAATVAFVVGAALATGAVVLLPHGSTTAAPLAVPAPASAVASTGDDPAATTCVDDAEVVASETRTRNTQLQIVWSPSCRAAWGRITRYDGKSSGNTVEVAVYRQIAPDAADRQVATEPDAQSAYTTMLVRKTAQTRICASGSLSVDGAAVDLGAPVCF